MDKTNLGTTMRGELGSPSQSVMHHPLFEHSVLLQTPPIDDIYRIVKRAVLMRETGCVFTGESGIGKTDAIVRVMTLLKSQYPRLCMFAHDAHNQQISSVRAFFKHFLSDVGQKEQRGETFDLRARLITILVDEARVSGMKLVVIFVDEANAMQLQDFLFLKDVYNDLSREHVQLVTILMGQAPDMQNVIAKLKALGRMDLISRFTMRMHHIRGYNCLEDLKVIFKGIDTRQYPEGSGIMWPAFFIPQAWAAGYRMENDALHVFKVIQKALPGTPKRKISLPARPLFLAIRSFLLHAADYDNASGQLPTHLWPDAIQYAMIQDSAMRLQGQQRTKRSPG